MHVKPALPNEFNVIQSIAARTWPETYGEILSEDQLGYMLDMMYSVEALNRNYDDGVLFVLAGEDGDYLGFAGFEHDYRTKGRTHIHKIYVLPEAQGKKVGRMLMNHIENSAVGNGSESITLNVNRSNSARFFYEKSGFSIVESVDIGIGNGYLMEDYVMRKPLR